MKVVRCVLRREAGSNTGFLSDKISMDGVTGRRIADVLVKVAYKQKSEPWLLLHLEVQGNKVKHFAHRVYTYHARIADRYALPVSNLVIFTDDNPGWQPSVYKYRAPGFELRATYATAKLLAYESHYAALQASDNPFAIVILTHLAAMRANHKQALRVESKISLMQHIYCIAKKYAKERRWVQEVINFIDFIFPLVGEDAVKYHDQLIKIEEETQMTYIESLEQMAKQQGIEEGMQQGMQQGIEKGIKKIIISMVKKGFPDEMIRELSGLTDADFNILKQYGVEST